MKKYDFNKYFISFALSTNLKNKFCSMLVHSVFFWLKENLSEKEVELFRNELGNLGQIPEVEKLYIGKPAPTSKRPVIDDSYDFCLTVVLENVSAHDKYQESDIHLEFIEKCSQLWERVKIYDAE